MKRVRVSALPVYTIKMHLLQIGKITRTIKVRVRVCSKDTRQSPLARMRVTVVDRVQQLAMLRARVCVLRARDLSCARTTFDCRSGRVPSGRVPVWRTFHPHHHHTTRAPPFLT